MSMRQRLILHIGTHKTGSTTIQNYFYFNRLWLRFLGVHYPLPVKGPLFFVNNHSDLRDTARLEEHPRAPRQHPALGSHDMLLGRYVNAIREVGAPVAILSAEGWSSDLNRYAHRLKPLQNRFDVQVVAFMRRPDHWAEAFYRQRVANLSHRETTPFADFVRQPPMQSYLFDRASHLAWWADAFGAENVTIIPYEPAVPGFDLIARFCDAAGLPRGIVRHLLFRRARANPTLSRAQAERLRQANERGQHPVRPRRSHATGEASYFTEAERAALLVRAAPDMAKIVTRYVRDGRTEMFPAEPEHFIARRAPPNRSDGSG